MNKEAVNEPGKEWLANGVNILSSAALGAAGFLATSLEGGVLIGCMSGLSPIAGDVLARSLSRKENERVKTVAFLAAREIGFNMGAGMELRKDDFFEVKGTRPAAEEIFEGVLSTARAEHEESKLPYLANLYASIPFDPSVSRGEANRLIQQLELLTYQKMCILALLSREFGFEGLHKECIHNMKIWNDELPALMQDCIDLENQGLLTQVDYEQSPSNGPHSWGFVVPALLRIARPGCKLIDLAKLSQIPETDVHHIRETMKT
ncbi:hypothetical protein C8R21_12525 [Nitrosospira multiformis]|uniref:Uncharacterized protein n=1 Tax=Nitrosospira multiformis TaxID=1231 RepID=A0A2T5I6Z8_9PROT|nr:hypothetical protein [Nitrosospira multiformis]PTQ79590.1 hypothetical protein C8R21_12525 [Nitrosospira multiformis]